MVARVAVGPTSVCGDSFFRDGGLLYGSAFWSAAVLCSAAFVFRAGGAGRRGETKAAEQGTAALQTLRPDPRPVRVVSDSVAGRYNRAGQIVPAPARAPPGGLAGVMPKEASRTIHGYTLIRRLGEGTFGEVWEATAPGGIPAAVKLIYYTRSQAAAQLELDALDLLKTLKHAYLLPTYASFVESDQVVIAMELADGTLRQRLSYCKNENLPGVPVPELLHYMRQAADALDY